MIMQLNQFLDSNVIEMTKFWQELVNTDTTKQVGKQLSLRRINVNLLRELNQLKLNGTFCEHPNSKYNGEYIGIWNIGYEQYRNKKPIIFLGHCDTVLPVYPLFEYDVTTDIATGSGVLDMKGGIVVMLYTTLALMKAGYDRPIRLIVTSQEETGHVGVDGFEEFMIGQCKDGIAAFSFETASLNHDIIVERAGTLSVDVNVIGRAAHAGRDPNAGIDAVNKAIQMIKSFTTEQKDNRYRVTVGKIQGGQARNVICDKVKMEWDVRIYHPDAIKIVTESLMTWNGSQSDGSIIEIVINSGIPIMPRTAKTIRLWEYLKEMAIRHDIPIGDAISSGGGGDATYAVLAGLPILDQMGVEGEHNHTNREYALVSSLQRKIKLAFLAAFNIAEIE